MTVLEGLRIRVSKKSYKGSVRVPKMVTHGNLRFWA